MKRYSLVVSAEHASNAVPARLSNLGLEPSMLETHVAWDPGVLEVATHVARAHGAPLFLGKLSRLVVDLNRSPSSPEAVPEIAFGVPVPGNAGLDADARRARIRDLHEPYWRAVQAAVRERLDGGNGRPERVLHFSVHSFTDELAGKKRDLDLGLLFDPACPLEREVADAMRAVLVARGFDTRDNEPYDGRCDALVTACRGVFPTERYAGVEIEISHRLLGQLPRVASAVSAAISTLAEVASAPAMAVQSAAGA